MKKEDKYYAVIMGLLMGLAIWIFFHYSQAKADACIFAGNGVKCLKDQLQFSPSLNRYMTGDTDDPTVVDKDGIAGDVYIRSGTAEMYIKTDTGRSKNWTEVTVGG